ncbi:MAG: histone deacetylase [Candidatus Eremiobacteraeota bacterium]|nr:histone deacetylase [Candidatus Eremiobacteraeota bacterium]
MSKSESIYHLDEKADEFCEKCYEISSKSYSVPVAKHENATDVKFIYSPGYFADIGQHVFPVIKYRVIYEKLIDGGITSPENVLTPEPASWEDLSIFLEPEYIDDMKNLNWSKRTFSSELPLNKEITDAFKLAAGGTYLAGVNALDCGFALNLTGGFHHAYRDHAEGFCYINDVAYAILKLKKEGLIEKAAVLDCDLHQGNGTAFIFRDDPDVFTFSIHQENNYPLKEKSDLDIGLEDGAGDDIYLARLRRNIPAILEFHEPDIVFYLAGGDPYRNDQLGGLNLSLNGLLQRDQLVIGQCRRRGIPVAVVLAGGYADKFEDTVRIHLNTAEAGVGGFG